MYMKLKLVHNNT